MEVKIQTLTPIWTGGIEAGKCDRIHETSILGSLRWWMEALVRGFGGQVCDPTEQECLYDLKKPNNGLCKVCEVFGATGWKRQFRLEVQNIEISDANITHSIKAERTYKNGKREEKTPTWYFRDSKPPNTPKKGTFFIKIQSLNPKFKPEIIVGLIQFIADCSALGARPQMGFGVIKVEGDYIKTQPLYDWLIAINGSQLYPKLPTLQNIFLAEIKPKDSNSSFTEQDTFNLKYDLRKLFRTENNAILNKSEHKGLVLKKNKKDKNINNGDVDKDLRHFIMGTVEDKRMAAKIKISRSYNNEKLIRVWGWIPEKAEVYKNGWDREKIVNDIYKHLVVNYTLHIWRETDSTRDTETPLISEVTIFLHSLLQLQEKNYAV
ncbi:type III-B CRISPR module RAMP protein Cmr1 [Nostoc sp. 'Peltigera membranacea cyanobiont' 213]|uniref:type III-B CRISPR module RAMP protein Cmr1 n=1 Tax=Nostoc sp. 'Peltigera membranacea cyanobiont' 213 TaxID=2014530 RepID=UPI000B95726F|nr:type III-B CRISPR module RAMP protein Cmr1 [Nostoc sp. 'Peltigera membranacea cyanobiont' 213]OYD86912.1 type III-B CRISPR module RAMP protein Cmr1 [Nostoc sp. 'Peltigera membranacea cyanobiont' 213]